jgi:diphosphomevalonate decarboxylase
MTRSTATARAHPNIAFIKYWGNRDDALRLPENDSLSMNLDGLYAETSVSWDASLQDDTFSLNGTGQGGEPLARVVRHLDLLRSKLNLSTPAAVTSVNNFPTGAGIASSAAAFAALTEAAVAASGQTISERERSILARQGSGSAARSIPGGFVEWHAGTSSEDSFAESVVGPDYWNLVDVIAVVSEGHKAVGSSAGHRSARTSTLQAARVIDAPRRFAMARQALLDRDFDTLASVVELDSNLMHSVMMTSAPPLFYWEPASLTLMKLVSVWRADGLQVCYTLDAGPNVHCICTRQDADQIHALVAAVDGVRQVIVAGVGGAAVAV